MQISSNYTSFLATPKGRRWVLLCIGFTIATVHIFGLTWIDPSPINFFNVGIMLFFYALTWSLIPMTRDPMNSPKFQREQTVSFIGGIGKIKNHQSNSGTWLYEVEMESNSEPGMDRVGNETKLFLEEKDLQQIVEDMPVRDPDSEEFLVRSR